MNFKTNPKKPSTAALRVIPVFEEEPGKTLLEKEGIPGPARALFSGKKDSSYSFESAGQLILLLGLGENPDYKTIENSFRRVLSKNTSLTDNGVFLDFADRL